MEKIREWAFSACTAAVIGAVVKMFVPKGGTGKIVTLCVKVFFLCCLFSPLIGMVTGLGTVQPEAWEQLAEISAEESEGSELQHQLESRILLEFCTNVERLAADTLQEMGIKEPEVAVSIHIASDNRISISDVEVTLSEDERMREAEVLLAVRERTGVTPKLRFKTEDSGL